MIANRLLPLTLSLPLVFAAPAGAVTIDAVINKLETVNSMRESLAATLENSDEPITEETFKRVCGPVGTSLRSWAEAEGLRARQVSRKFRNPAHKADARDLEEIREFEKDKSRLYIVKSRTLDGSEGFQIYRRIEVRQNCLHCHGEKERLPGFIKKKYPNDRAFGFTAGDLRGLYSVWISSSSVK